VTSRYTRILGNRKHREVDDLHNEYSQCQIDEILTAQHAVGFVPDTVARAIGEGFDRCHWCLGGSLR
jgi:hypothetical protein